MTLTQVDQVLGSGMISPPPTPAVVGQKSPGQIRLKPDTFFNFHGFTYFNFSLFTVHAFQGQEFIGQIFLGPVFQDIDFSGSRFFR